MTQTTMFLEGTTQPVAPPVKPPGLAQERLGAVEGRLLKQEGQERVLGNEEWAWKTKAFELIRALLVGSPTFTADDVRDAILHNGLGHPHHDNVYGSLMRQIALKGWARRSDRWVKSKHKICRSRQIPIWTSNLYSK